MNDKDKQLLEEFIEYKENNSAKYIVINKDNISSIISDYNGATICINPAPNKTYWYEFNNDSVIGQVMKLLAEKDGSNKKQ